MKRKGLPPITNRPEAPAMKQPAGEAKRYFITRDFDYTQPAIGSLSLGPGAEKIQGLNEYVIVPEAVWDESKRCFKVTGWALVHRTSISQDYAKAMEQKEQEFRA